MNGGFEIIQNNADTIYIKQNIESGFEKNYHVFELKIPPIPMYMYSLRVKYQN